MINRQWCTGGIECLLRSSKVISYSLHCYLDPQKYIYKLFISFGASDLWLFMNLIVSLMTMALSGGIVDTKQRNDRNKYKKQLKLKEQVEMVVQKR